MTALEPWLTPYDPIRSKGLAEDLAMPQWVTIFPQYRNLPPTIELPVNWSVSRNSEFVNVDLGEEVVSVRYFGGGNARANETEYVYLGVSFSYQYSAPRGFYCGFRWEAKSIPVGEVGYSLELVLVSSQGYNYSIWDSTYKTGEKRQTSIPLLTKDKEMTLVEIYGNAFDLKDRLGVSISENIAELVFSRPGEYGLLMHICFKPNSENATCEINLKDTKFRIPGLVHGILGTTSLGADIWSQLVSGIGISLMIGLSAAVLLTCLGVIVGVVSGYVGGIIDEVLMRVADILMSLPVLPLLMILMFMFGTNVSFVILLVALFGWTGLARIIRSQVLTIREMTFIESAKAIGAGRFYIISRHIVPNVLPTAFAAMVLSVPEAILWQAGLSFLGLSDPDLMTWGKMLNQAFWHGGFMTASWWWIIPPGLALTLLCLAFVFIGQAMDEILNPKLRRR